MSAPRNRTALVTGSARRVGRMVATALIADGWDVVIHATDDDRARRAADELGARTGIGADLANATQVRALAEAVAATFDDGLGLLVNNAATFERVDRWQDVDMDGWARSMDVNARAPYLLTAGLVDRLTAAQGCVVNISDGAVHEPWGASYPVHAASKAALESLTRTGARALARAGVRVNAIVPGTILPPDDWSDERVERERRAGNLQDVGLVIDAIRTFAADPQRTGEIVRL